MTKEHEQALRNFHFSFAELIANVENFGKLCPADTLMEMCETLAGIMAEQTQIISEIESIGSEKEWNEIREKFRRPLVGERFYSSHFEALCDMMRLAKHMKTLSKSKDVLLSDIKRLERYEIQPCLDTKLVHSILDAIPRVKTLRSDD